MAAAKSNPMHTGRETYLDWNATAPLRPEAAAAVSDALASWGNPSSVHRRGRLARRIIERAREEIAALLGGVDPRGVVFVSGGTEANNLALLGIDRERILVSAVEHDSVRQVLPTAETIPVDSDGVVALDALDRLLAADPRPALVSVMFANNETGVIQPVGEIASLARRYGALFHCDAVQAAGRLALDAGAIGADFISLSAHKLGGPPGVGALVVIGDLDFAPLRARSDPATCWRQWVSNPPLRRPPFASASDGVRPKTISRISWTPGPRFAGATAAFPGEPAPHEPETTFEHGRQHAADLSRQSVNDPDRPARPRSDAAVLHRGIR